MEPPAKRIRLTKPPHYDPDDDYRVEDDEAFESSPGKSSPRDRSDDFEDDLEDEEDTGSQDAYNEPDDDDLLAQERAKLDNRFQQAMAGIFSKYGRDFEGIGDEVDLETGDVIVDNGHLKNMRYENDVGIDEDFEEGGVRLEDLPDDDEDDGDEGIALTDIPDGWGQDGAANGEHEEAVLNAATDTSLLQPVTSKNNPFMGFIARQPSPYTTAVFAPAETVPPDDDVQGGEFKDTDATESQVLEPRTKPASPAAPQVRAAGPYDGQDSIWAPGPRFRDHWSNGLKSQVATKNHTRKSYHGVLHDQPLNEVQRQSANSQEGKRNGLEQANLWETDEDLSSYLVLGDPDGLQDKGEGELRPLPQASVATASGKPVAQKERKTTSPESKPSRQPQIQAEERGHEEKLDEDVSASVDESAACRRRSGRARKKVEFLGLTSWEQALQDDASNQLAVESRIEEQRPTEDINDDQGLPTPPESGHDTSDGEQPPAPKSSKSETVPDSQETATSRRSSPPRHQAVESTTENRTLGDITLDLSDDESPVFIAKSQLGAAKDRPRSAARNSGDALRQSADETETMTVQYTLAEPSLALSDDESPVVFKQIKRNSTTKPDQTSERIEEESRTTIEGPVGPLAVEPKLIDDPTSENPPLLSESPIRKDKEDLQDTTEHDEDGILLDTTMDDADEAPLTLENETETFTEPVAVTKHIESEESSQVVEEEDNQMNQAKDDDGTAPEQTPTEMPTRPPAIASRTSASPKATTANNSAQLAPEKSREDLSEAQESTRQSGEVLACKKSSQTIADSQEEGTEDEPQTTQESSSGFDSIHAPITDTSRSPSARKSSKPKPSSPLKQPSIDPLPSGSPVQTGASAQSSSLPPEPSLQSRPTQPASQREETKEKSSPLKRPPARPTPSKTRPGRRDSIRSSSPLNPLSSNPTPSKSHTGRQSSTKPSKTLPTRRSILTLVQDDDDDELLGNEADAVTLPKLLGTPSKRRVWKTSARTTEQFRTPTKKRDKDVFSPGSVVKTPGGSKKICGVDGFRCERDFCFSCLS